MMQIMVWQIDTLSDAFTERARVRGKKSCLSHLIVLVRDGGWSAVALFLHRLLLSSQAHSELCST